MMKIDLRKLGAAAVVCAFSAALAVPAMAQGWAYEGKAWRYYDADGAIVTNAWIYEEDDGEYYYVGKDGKMATGWQWVDGFCYYLDPAEDGAMAYNVTVDGYKLSADGAWVDDNGTRQTKGDPVSRKNNAKSNGQYSVTESDDDDNSTEVDWYDEDAWYDDTNGPAFDEDLSKGGPGSKNTYDVYNSPAESAYGGSYGLSYGVSGYSNAEISNLGPQLVSGSYAYRDPIDTSEEDDDEFWEEDEDEDEDDEDEDEDEGEDVDEDDYDSYHGSKQEFLDNQKYMNTYAEGEAHPSAEYSSEDNGAKYSFTESTIVSNTGETRTIIVKKKKEEYEDED